MEMSAIESKLTRLEASLRGVVEGDSTRGGIPRKLHQRVLHALVRAMQTEIHKQQAQHELDDRVIFAPDLYTIVLPVEGASMLINHPQALDRLAQKLEVSAAQANLQFAGSPVLRVVPDPNAKDLYILAEYCHVDLGDSCTTEMDGMLIQSSVMSNGGMPNAFLIVNGLATFLLNQAVINIGCDPTNQLILNDPGVSRIHCQLRFISDRFVIFDLDSSQGTYINGVPVTSQALNPGDVILLAGVPLVYGQERSAQLGYTQKLPAEPLPPEVL